MIREKFELKNSHIYLLILSVIFIFITTPNFSLEESLNFGGRDGFDYYKISKNAPEILINIQYIKAERFFFPYIIGVLSKLFSLDIFELYKVFSIIFCISLILLFNRLLTILNCSQKIRLIFLLLIILNPYILRYYISIPTLLNDLIFLNISILLCIGLILNKNILIFISILIGALCRQNVLAFLISVYLIFFFETFYNHKKKFLKFKTIIIITSTYIFAQFINYFYAKNSQNAVSAEELYFVTIFGIFIDNFNFERFVKFVLFPFLSFGPLFFLLTMSKIKLKFENKKFLFFLISSSLMLVAQPFLGGPTITGKNFIRLANYCYPISIVIIYLISDKERINKIFNTKFYDLFLIILFVWSLHPTFSTIKFFNFLRFDI